jgi:hypothetical protein
MAVVYSNYDTVLQNLQFQIEAVPALVAVSALIEAYRVANIGFLETPLDLGNRNQLLKNLTGCVVATQNALNCYPLGLDTTLCFDLDGNEVP